jgi:hypothetical protein
VVSRTPQVRQNSAMRLDHVSYATAHDSVIDVIQRIGSQLGASFIDGGIHPQFGTRNFILPLKESRYIEVVCPLDHPAADKTPFGQLVSKKVDAGGGWLTWVVAVNDLAPIEEKLQRKAITAHRKKPDGNELFWRQIGVLDTLDQASNPFFIEWQSDLHPSTERDSVVALSSLEIHGSLNTLQKRYGLDDFFSEGDIQFEWIGVGNETGIESVTFLTHNGKVRID